jgi:hypothetical protein
VEEVVSHIKVGTQSPCRLRTRLQRPRYVGSPKESDDAGPSHRTIAMSGGIDVGAHQILARKTPITPQHTPPPERGTQVPQEHDR